MNLRRDCGMKRMQYCSPASARRYQMLLSRPQRAAVFSPWVLHPPQIVMEDARPAVSTCAVACHRAKLTCSRHWKIERAESTLCDAQYNNTRWIEIKASARYTIAGAAPSNTTDDSVGPTSATTESRSRPVGKISQQRPRTMSRDFCRQDRLMLSLRTS